MSGENEANGTRDEDGYVTVDGVLAAHDLVEEDIAVPEWGGKVRIRSLTVEQQDEYRTKATVNDEVDQKLASGYLFLTSVIRPRFTADRLEQLRKKAAAPFNRVIKRCLAINGLSEEAVPEAERSFQEGSA